MILIDRLTKWWRRRQDAGPRGERVAARHLKREGYRILGRNLRNRFGEIDILAQAPDGRTLVVVEVKSRVLAAGDPGSNELRPEIHVNADKKRRLVTLAAQIARRHHLTDRPIRFDIIGVDLPARGKPIVRHHVCAFESRV